MNDLFLSKRPHGYNVHSNLPLTEAFFYWYYFSWENQRPLEKGKDKNDEFGDLFLFFPPVAGLPWAAASPSWGWCQVLSLKDTWLLTGAKPVWAWPHYQAERWFCARITKLCLQMQLMMLFLSAKPPGQLLSPNQRRESKCLEGTEEHPGPASEQQHSKDRGQVPAASPPSTAAKPEFPVPRRPQVVALESVWLHCATRGKQEE